MGAKSGWSKTRLMREGWGEQKVAGENTTKLTGGHVGAKSGWSKTRLNRGEGACGSEKWLE